MDISHFLAKFFGAYMLIIAAIWLWRRDQFYVTVRHVVGNENTYALTAILQIIIGLLILIAHPIWVFNWQGLITLLALLALIQGILRLAFPEETSKYVLRGVQNGYWYMMGFLVIAGGILAYHGYFA